MVPNLNLDLLREVFERTPEQKGTNPDPLAGAAHLASFALVCKEWHSQATEILWRDLGGLLCRHDGYNVPTILRTISTEPYLGNCVRSLHITAPLEGALWTSTFHNEGDVFAALLRACPNVCDVMVPSFEVASKSNVLDALRQAQRIEKFNIRVYLESVRRSARFESLIPFFDWDTETIADLLQLWPRLTEFTVRHIPEDAYHMRPDCVLAPVTPPRQLQSHSAPIRRLHLHETYIDDAGLFNIISGNALTELTLMSCQGITSSAVTKEGLIRVIKECGATLKTLKIMTPWLASDTQEPRLALDHAVKYCTSLSSLTLAGWDISDSFFANLQPGTKLIHLGITDFEAVTPFGLLGGLSMPALKSLQRLAIWQRNGGTTASGTRISRGWFTSLFETNQGRLIRALRSANVKVGTGWESRLLSGGDLEYWDCKSGLDVRLLHQPSAGMG